MYERERERESSTSSVWQKITGECLCSSFDLLLSPYIELVASEWNLDGFRSIAFQWMLVAKATLLH